MTTRQWPWPGESHVVRARKVALAYRNVARQLTTELLATQTLYKRLDRRLLDSWEPDQDTVKALDVLLANLGDQVHELDERFKQWGEDWHAEVPVAHDDDDLIDAIEAAKILHLAPHSISRIRCRGKIEGVFLRLPGDHSAKWYFKVSDVYRLQKERRPRDSRKPDATDTVGGDGSGDP